MPRLSRPVIPGQPLHLVQRGNNRVATFSRSVDCRYYLRLLGEASQDSGCALHAYVLMSNHVHLLVTPRDERGPARMMQAIGRRYVRYFNEHQGRTGTLWEGRFRSTLIDSERYFLACSRYVELNPVRAGIVRDPGAYPWSSFRCNARGETDALVTPHAVYLALATRPANAYLALFSEGLGTEVVDAIRQASRSDAVLGDESFRERVEAAVHRRLTTMPHGGDRRSATFRRARQSLSTTLTP
jgi:putative transposase